MGAVAVLLLLFLGFSDWNYRSRDGWLGRTVPAWQAEIVAGTAPAPYVYRQGVPQFRRLLSVVFRPGHAAVLVDLFFAAVAIASGLALGRHAMGAAYRWSGAFLALLACAAVYPNDKPESVAMVSLALLVLTFAVAGRDLAAASVATIAVPFRPELSILLGLSFAIAGLRHRQCRRAGTGAAYAVAAVAGLSYLACSRFVFWPEAVYPAGTRAFMMVANLTDPRRYVGLALLALLGAVGVAWTIRAWHGPAISLAEERLAEVDRRSMLGVGLFIVFWTLAVLTLGKADEIRLLMPVVPACLLFGLGPWTPWRA